MKRKSLSLLLSGLLTVCLTGVGFASWLIVQGETKTYNTGTVVVETVSEKSITISAIWKDSKDTFNFTGLENANTGWLRSDTKTPADLDLTLVVTVLNMEFDADGIVEIGFTPSNTTKYENVTKDMKNDVDGNQSYLVAPTISNHTFDEDSASFTAANGDTPSSYVFEVPVAFTWGQYFGGVNPYTYYNADGRTYSSHGAEAKTALTDLHTQLDGMHFTVSIKTA